jgi:hypothetical protein
VRYELGVQVRYPLSFLKGEDESVKQILCFGDNMNIGLNFIGHTFSLVKYLAKLEYRLKLHWAYLQPGQVPGQSLSSNCREVGVSAAGSGLPLINCWNGVWQGKIFVGFHCLFVS